MLRERTAVHCYRALKAGQSTGLVYHATVAIQRKNRRSLFSSGVISADVSELRKGLSAGNSPSDNPRTCGFLRCRPRRLKQQTDRRGGTLVFCTHPAQASDLDPRCSLLDGALRRRCQRIPAICPEPTRYPDFAFRLPALHASGKSWERGPESGSHKAAVISSRRYPNRCRAKYSSAPCPWRCVAIRRPRIPASAS